MSETYRQQALGPPTFIDAGARSSSSGRDAFDSILDAAHLYHDHNFRQDRMALPLQIPGHDSYTQDDQFGYASHSNEPSLSGLQYTSPIMNGHMSTQYEHEQSILEDIRGFSPITQSYNINAYRTPYPDSNATSASSAASPDPTITDMIVEVDEDKRKRNQAASARFRQKKKQREQQLVDSSREMQDRTKKLQAENEGLKKENSFLKKLLVEKVDHMSEEDREILLKATSEVLKKKK
ncbi:hypothetical protein P153DRAFT_376708 [Dothidotthia symphoricarpi CBS 119687]|uniref:BZIP domain-containing protein n=1 Tax=Dothidotthia symphoricarpi CBS 119687 TaxID=1392245 RepID=A0A6A6A9W7_9PLEO|nr:uncharacterized protein P153DRAFT_376708 [Dothidotthia symphoricarpi CBS 119687]KAF2128589.1 hypothetical protein P153DRAFT_376708 [Dothidotthia symphoricarpi CBS 119687]